MSFRVQCSENFYGPNCATFCKPQADVYTCDSEGRAVCTHNGRDIATNCTDCLPERNSSTNCTTCLYSLDLDPSTNCRECHFPGQNPGKNCTECLSGYTGEKCNNSVTITEESEG